jgi:hypothetical protein
VGFLLPFREVGKVSHWIDSLKRFPTDPGPVMEPMVYCAEVVAILAEA